AGVWTGESVVDVKSFEVKPYAAEKEHPSDSLPVTAPEKKPVPSQLRIVAVIDGKDQLVLTRTEARWTHFSFDWPTKVTLNKVEWTPPKKGRGRQETCTLKTVGLTRLLGKRVNDLSKVELTKIRGRGPVTLQTGPDFVAVVFDDNAHMGADTYEIVLKFRE